MPELPEVENARRILIKAELPGRVFTAVQVGWANSVKRPSVEDFVLGLHSRRVEEVNRRGKYLLLALDSGETLIIHLGMTGGLSVRAGSPTADPADPMVRHTFTLDDGRELRFRDPRKFGHLWLTTDAGRTLPALGPEPLSPDFTPKVLAAALAGRSAPVKALLLEQSAVAGLGNLYVDESLYGAGLHPLRPAGGLGDGEIIRLQGSIVSCLTVATAQYDRARETEWPAPPAALHTWTIPRKAGASCPKCGDGIAGIRVRGRGTFYCPGCQPES